MAYQNIGTPRFYVDTISWLKSLGWSFIEQGVRAGINPSSVHDPTEMDSASVCRYLDFTPVIPKEIKFDFCAVLGHNYGDQGINLVPYFHTISMNYNQPAFTDIVNTGGYYNYFNFSYNGFSIAEITAQPNYLIDDIKQIFLYWDDGQNIWDYSILYTGAFLWGSIYDMPHSPELKLTMTREMDGVKRVRTKGGVDLVHHKYLKSPMWGDAAAWELYQGTPTGQELSKIGRRTWDLSFNYMQGSDMFAPYEILGMEITNYPGQYYPVFTTNSSTYSGFEDDDVSGGGDNHFNSNLLTDDSFFSQVIHKTNGGQLPFIFQPDSNNNNPDQFAICKLDMNKFQFKQVANGVYNMNLKIREVW